MKKKPDVSSFQRPSLVKDPTSFLEDAAADKAEKPQQAKERGKPPAKEPGPALVQKIFRLSPDVVAALKRHATERSIAEGRRVTEQEIADQMFRKFLEI